MLNALVASPPSIDRQRLAGSDITAASSERLREATRLLEEKASPEDADAYRTFVLSVARAAAAAHKEGGFIGIGGKRISDEEQAAIDDIGRLLKAE